MKYKSYRVAHFREYGLPGVSGLTAPMVNENDDWCLDAGAGIFPFPGASALYI